MSQRVISVDELREDLLALKDTMEQIGRGHHWTVEYTRLVNTTLPLVKAELERRSTPVLVA